MVPEQSHEFSPRGDKTANTFSFLEYDKAREKIPESTRASVDAWREEILAICQAHGVDHPSKLVLAETHASIQTLERVQNLLDDILYVFEHQELPTEKKKEVEPVDDREYVVELGELLENPCNDIRVYDHNGRFYFFDNHANPSRLFDHEGNKDVLPSEMIYQDFVLLGSRLVLVAKKRMEQRSWKFLTGLDGEPLDPPRDFNTYSEIRDHLVTMGEGTWGEETVYPVSKDGTIHWETPFDLKGESIIVDTALIDGHPYFLTSKPWMIYTADHQPVGNPDGYAEKPVLCDRDGEFTLLVKDRDEKNPGWWIYDKEGNPIKEIKTTFTIESAMFINGQYFFTARKETEEVLLNEQGAELWKNSTGEQIDKLLPCHSGFIFSTRTITKDPFGADEVDQNYYDQQGRPIVWYPSVYTSPETPPIFVGDSYAFIIQRSENDQRQNVQHRSFPEITIGTFERVYVMETIDDDRFYVIGLEKKGDKTYQVAKRVYDTRTFKQ